MDNSAGAVGGADVGQGSGHDHETHEFIPSDEEFEPHPEEEINYYVFDREPNDINITRGHDGEGSIWKRMITEGEGNAQPEYGMIAAIHYVETVMESGHVVEDTNSYGQCVEIAIGALGNLDVFDHAIPTMKKGEKAQFIASPEFAYGRSRQPHIPSGSTIKFEIELVDWIDCFGNIGNGDTEFDAVPGKIIRNRIEVPADEVKRSNVVANDGAFVKVSFEGSFEGRVFETRKRVEFFVGDGDLNEIPVAINSTIRSFVVGEKSTLTVDPEFAFGKIGHQDFGIPPNSKVTYLVELHYLYRVDEIDEQDVKPIVERLYVCRELYKVAGILNKIGSTERALQKYQHIIICLQKQSDWSGHADQFIDERSNLLFKAHLALGKGLMKPETEEQPNHDKVLENLHLALEYDQSSVEGWRCLGRLHLSPRLEIDLDKALECFCMAELLDPDNADVKTEIKNCRQKQKDFKRKESELASKMLGLDLKK